jgi:hypothetical protein
VQCILLSHQVVLGFYVVLVVQAAVYRANGSTLWLIMETYALGTLICNYIIVI